MSIAVERRLNGRFLIGSIVCAFVLSGLVELLHRFQVRRQTDTLAFHSTRAEAAGDLDAALNYQSRYVHFRPDDLSALERYADLIVRARAEPFRRVPAVRAYERILLAEPNRSDIRRRLLTLALQPGMDQNCNPLLHAELLVRQFSDDATLWFQHGQALALNGRSIEADQSLSRSLQLDASQLQATAYRAALLRGRLDRPFDADRLISEFVKANPKSFQAHLVAAGYWRECGRIDQFRASVDAARELAPNDRNVLSSAVILAREDGQLDEGRALLKRAMELYPDDANFTLELAKLEVLAGHPAEAIAVLKAALKTHANNLDLLIALLDRYADGPDLTEFDRLFPILQPRIDRPLADFLAARAAVTRRDYLGAARKLEQALPAFAQLPEFAARVCRLLAVCYSELGDLDRRANVLKRAVDLQPLDSDSMFRLASSYGALGRHSDAIRLYEQLANRYPLSRIPLARQILLRELDKPAAQRNWQLVNDAVAEAERLEPRLPDVEQLVAEVQLARGELDASRQTVRRALEQHPDHLPLWSLHIDLADAKEFETRVAEAEAKFGDHPDWRIARARHLFQLHGAGVDLVPLLAGAEKFDGEDRRRLTRVLLQIQLAGGNDNASIQLFREVLRLQPDDLGAHLAYFDLGYRTNSDAIMAATVEAIRRLDGPEGTATRMAGAVRQIWRAKQTGRRDELPAAQQTLTMVARDRPNWQQIPIAQAQILELLGEGDSAIPLYMRAIELGATDTDLIRRVVELLYQRKRYTEAEQILAKLPVAQLGSGTFGKMAAEIMVNRREYKRALELAAAAVPPDTKHSADLLWLGRIYAAAGQSADAERALRASIALAPAEPGGHLALVQLLNGESRFDDARAAAAAARQALTAPANRLALAVCEELVGQTEAARKIYARALSDQPNDGAALRAAAAFHLRQGELNECERLLTRVIDEGHVAPELAQWAKRILAIVMASRGSYATSRRALEVLGIFGDQPVEINSATSPEEMRARATVLSMQPDRRRRKDAIRLLEEVAARRAATPEDLYLLAQLHEGLGDWPQALERIKNLPSPMADSVPVLAFTAAAAIRHNQLTEAALAVEKLGQLLPQSMLFAEVKARLMSAKGQKREAVELIAEKIGHEEAGWIPAATILEQIGRPEAAEAYWQKFVAKAGTPEARLQYIQFLGRNNRTREALDECERLIQAGDVERGILSALTALYARSRRDPSSADRIERWAAALPAKVRQSEVYFHIRAALDNYSGDYDAAAKSYREILIRSPDSRLARNNLAFLLTMKYQKPAEAIALLEGHQQQAEGVTELLDTLSLSYAAAGRTRDAVRAAERSLDFALTPEGYFHLAYAQLIDGNRGDAHVAWNEAVRLGLDPEKLHPLERPLYERVRLALGS